jgi:hypothetical protein
LLLVCLVAAVAAAGAVVVVRRLGPPGDGAARLVPANALAYINVYLRPSLEQRQQLRSFLEAAGVASSGEEAGEVVGALAEASVAAVGLSFSDDVAPWAGDQIAGFFVPSPEGGRPAGALMIAAKDVSGARAAADAVRARAGGQVEETDGYSTSGSLAATIVDGWLVAGDEGAVRAATTASESGSLEEVGRYAQAVRDLEGDRLALGYLDGGQVGRSSALGFVGAGTTAAVSVSARGDTLVLRTASDGGFGLPSALLVFAGETGDGREAPAGARSRLSDGYRVESYLEGDEVRRLVEGLAGGAGVARVPEVRAFLGSLSYLVMGTKQEGDKTFVEVVLGAEAG